MNKTEIHFIYLIAIGLIETAEFIHKKKFDFCIPKKKNMKWNIICNVGKHTFIFYKNKELDKK